MILALTAHILGRLGWVWLITPLKWWLLICFKWMKSETKGSKLLISSLCKSISLKFNLRLCCWPEHWRRSPWRHCKSYWRLDCWSWHRFFWKGLKYASPEPELWGIIRQPVFIVPTFRGVMSLCLWQLSITNSKKIPRTEKSIEATYLAWWFIRSHIYWKFWPYNH